VDLNRKTAFSLSLTAILLMPALASADTFRWTFGGAGDTFTASGTLDAILISGSNNYQVVDGSGILDVNGMLVLPGKISGTTDLSGNTYALTLLPGENEDSKGIYWTPEDADGTDLGYDNLLIGGTSLDSNGIIFTSPDPYAPGYSLYFGPGPNNLVFEDLPDGTGWNFDNLINPFIGVDIPEPVTGSQGGAPEPSAIGLISLGLAGLVLLRRRADCAA